MTDFEKSCAQHFIENYAFENGIPFESAKKILELEYENKELRFAIELERRKDDARRD